jgi:hypothetical protein
LVLSIWLVLLIYAIGGDVTLNNHYGTISFDISSNSDRLKGSTWYLQPLNPVATSIEFTFQSMSVNNMELRILEYVSGTAVYTCISCSTNVDSTIPPTFYSSTGYVTIKAQGVDAQNYQTSQFTLQYLASTATAVSSVNDSTIYLNMGYNHIAPNLLTNGYLPRLTRQRWVIDQTSTLLLSFSNFQFPASCGSVQLTILDDTTTVGANTIYSACMATDIPDGWIFSSTGKALIILQNPSTADVAMDFEITYYSDTSLYNCGSLDTIEVLTDSTMLITDGSKSTNDMRKGVACKWMLQPENAGSTVTLFMQYVSIKPSGTVIVYDGSANGNVLWNCVGPTLVIPPPMTSTGSSLYIVYDSNTVNPTSYKGFMGEYQGNYLGSTGLGRGYTELYMPSVIDLVPPGNGASYTSDITYIWYIQPINLVSPNITFAISELNLQSGDSLTLYDGPSSSSAQIFQLTGTQTILQWYTTTSSSATLVLYSASTVSPSTYKSGNFKLSYVSDGPNYHCGFPTNPGTMSTQSMMFSDGSPSTSQVYKDQDCEWLLSPSISASIVVIFFEHFDLFDGKLQIYSGNELVATIEDSSAIPPPLVVSGDSATVIYQSDSTATGKGFSATYYGITALAAAPGNSEIKIYASSAVMLSLLYTCQRDYTIYIPSNYYVSWEIAPADSIGNIYISLAYTKLSGSDSLTLSDSSGSTIAVYSSNTVPRKWVEVSSDKVFVTFQGDNDPSNVADFGLSYYSNGPNNHCGFAELQGVLRAPSMVFTDGSSSLEDMYDNQYCEWLIQPNQLSSNITAKMETTIVLEFLESDLVGGNIEVYDGSTNSSALLWRCYSCDVIPPPIIGHTSTMLVIFSTSSAVSMGSGFKAVYWTISDNSNPWYDYRDGSKLVDTVLELPYNVEMSNSEDNTTASWLLLAPTTSTSTLSYYPNIQQFSLSELRTSVALDGRPTSNSLFESHSVDTSVCGFLSSVLPANVQYPISGYLSQQASQYSSRFIKSSIANKDVYKLEGSFDMAVTDGDDSVGSVITPAATCKYFIDSDSIYDKPVTVNFQQLQMFTDSTKARLSVYYGVNGYEELFIDTSGDPRVTVHTNDGDKDIRKALTVVPDTWIAPCGKATIIVEYLVANGTIDMGFTMDYVSKELDFGESCANYKESLLPNPAPPDPNIPYYIGFGSVIALILLCIGVYFLRVKLRTCKLPTISWPESKKYRVVTAQHPKYTPRLDRLRNRFFLPKGTCCVCREENVSVFPLSCNHGQCFECIKGYLDSCLGDISTFPVKCPLHFEGCTACIDSKIAKRVLNLALYYRFLEFSDRASYGEGMRCIFCSNYVNYPAEGAQAAVECPYCFQRFCIRCKKPWHYRGKCPLDNVDDSLEKYKALTHLLLLAHSLTHSLTQISSGAQTCPCCKKLIEKNDPTTCNHMVHKITDGIPCIRDRTDFCYMCGEEVTPDYPHEEVNNLGVNHFPDGVFQTCRIITHRDKEAERKKLLKLRRSKKNKMSNNIARSEISFRTGRSRTVAVTDGSEWDDLDGSFNPGDYNDPDYEYDSDDFNDNKSSGTDIFDHQWDLMLANSPVTASPTANNNSVRNNSPTSPTPTATSPTGQGSPVITRRYTEQPSPVNRNAPITYGRPTPLNTANIAPVATAGRGAGQRAAGVGQRAAGVAGGGRNVVAGRGQLGGRALGGRGGR